MAKLHLYLCQAISCAGLLIVAGFPEHARAQENVWNQLTSQVLTACRDAQYREAEQLANQALRLAEASIGDEPFPLVASLINLAEIARVQAHYSEAEAFLRRALMFIRDKNLPDDHPLAGILLRHLANLCRLQGRYEEADIFEKRSQEILETDAGAIDRPQTMPQAETAFLLPVSQDAQEPIFAVDAPEGALDDPDEFFSRTLVSQERILGSDHPDVARTLVKYAAFHQASQRQQQAVPLLEHAREIQEKRLGANHPQLAATLTYLADAYAAQGRPQEARALYQRSLAILTIGDNAVGSDHSDVAEVLRHWAEALKKEDPAQRGVLLKRALAIYLKLFGMEHAMVQQTLARLASPAQGSGLGVLGKALAPGDPEYQRFHEVMEQAAQSLSRETHSRTALGKAGVSKALFARALSIYEMLVGPDDPELMPVLEAYTVELYKAGDPQRAAEIEQRIERIRLKNHHDKRPAE